MARFGSFMKDQLLPEDPMDWVILILILGVAIGIVILIGVMFSAGLI